MGTGSGAGEHRWAIPVAGTLVSVVAGVLLLILITSGGNSPPATLPPASTTAPSTRMSAQPTATTSAAKAAQPSASSTRRPGARVADFDLRFDALYVEVGVVTAGGNQYRDSIRAKYCGNGLKVVVPLKKSYKWFESGLALDDDNLDGVEDDDLFARVEEARDAVLSDGTVWRITGEHRVPSEGQQVLTAPVSPSGRWLRLSVRGFPACQNVDWLEPAVG